MVNAEDAYEAHAEEFLRGRDPSPVGSQVVEQWARSLEAGATAIELACGGGYPVTKALKDCGLRLWAVDGSPTLVSRFRSRFSDIPVRCERVQDSDFFGLRFQAAVAIGLLFLLPEADQAGLIFRVADILLPGGRFLFTAPIQAGAWSDSNTGIESLSLGKERYEGLMADAGLRLVDTYQDVGENNYYDAQRFV